MDVGPSSFGSRVAGGDGELLARARNGPSPEARTAWAALYERHAGPLLRHLRRILDDPNDADDILQDTFLLLAQQADPLCVEDALPRLLAIAGNLARHMRRRRRRRARRARRERAVSATEATEASLDAALAGLEERERAVLELRIRGLTHSEVAAALGASERTAQRWSAHALASLHASGGGR